jgi:predicted NBD/HSP70 family sugar kinase
MIGTNHEYLQAFNQRLLLSKVWREGPISRADLARSTHLATPTVYRLTGELLRQKLLLEGEQRRGGLGKPPLELSINPEGGYAIGFNFDRDQLVGVLTDLNGRTLQRLRYELEVARATPEVVFSLIEEATALLLQHSELVPERLMGIGLGIPGPLHLKPFAGAELFELPGWEGRDVASELSHRLGRRVILENNPIAAAIGELWYGGGRQLENFFFIFFGLYLGGCMVLAREPNRGYGGFGGEFGSVPYGRNPRSPDGVARLGHRVSLAGLHTTLAEAGIGAYHEATLEALFEAQNPVLLGWLDEAVDYLAPELLRLEYFMDPEAIVFGERLPAELFNYLIARLETRLGDLRISYKPYAPKLLRGWAGVDAAAVGAAALPIYEALEPNPALLLNSPASRYDRARGAHRGLSL